jgi:hypothetical protein
MPITPILHVRVPSQQIMDLDLLGARLGMERSQFVRAIISQGISSAYVRLARTVAGDASLGAHFNMSTEDQPSASTTGASAIRQPV